jgi:aspartate/methionine/tyrosine aminotransferase
MRGPVIPPFYAGQIGTLAWARKRAGLPVVSMHFGQPTAGAPAAAITLAHRLLDRDSLGYHESVPLQERLARYYRDTHGVEVDRHRILLTAGASAGLVAAYAACFRSGDRVAVITPGYPTYRHTLRALGIQPVELRCAREQGFRPTPAMIAALDPAPQGLVLASPANPTGTMLEPEELAAMVAVCRSRGIQLISDEIYHGITFGKRCASALEYDQGVVIINSFSKLYRMPGWRLGWMVVPEGWVDNVNNYVVNMFLTPPTLAQYAALAALDETDDLQRWVDIYALNRARLTEGLARLGITDIAPPDGAFYLYADVGHITQDSLQFCRRTVKETGVALAPGIDFDPTQGNRFIRLSFAVSPAEIEKALELLADWIPRYQDEARP